MATVYELIAVLLFVGALFIGTSSFVDATQATVGVWLVCFACLLAIVARIMQAEGHQLRAQKRHEELLRRLPPGG